MILWFAMFSHIFATKTMTSVPPAAEYFLLRPLQQGQLRPAKVVDSVAGSISGQKNLVSRPNFGNCIELMLVYSLESLPLVVQPSLSLTPDPCEGLSWAAFRSVCVLEARIFIWEFQGLLP
jgi:hypothetical protein